jgi:hypothetical protein
MFIKSTLLKTLSLCVVGIFAATIASFSQTGDSTPNVELNTATPRVITSSDGKTILARLVAKTQDGVEVIRLADGKRLNIPLDRLCDTDQTLIKNWTPVTVSNYRPSSVSIAGNATLQRGSYPSAYQPRYSAGRAHSGSSGHVTTTGKKTCTLTGVRVVVIPGSCPTPCK